MNLFPVFVLFDGRLNLSQFSARRIEIYLFFFYIYIRTVDFFILLLSGLKMRYIKNGVYKLNIYCF